MLGKLILKEKHELEEQRQALVEEVTSYKKKIKQLEDDLLFRLSNSTAWPLSSLPSFLYPSSIPLHHLSFFLTPLSPLSSLKT